MEPELKKNNHLLTISQLAGLAGISKRTIHLHEKRGFITSIRNSENGNRYFTNDMLFRIQKISQLQTIGLSIKEISEVLPLYLDGNDNGVKGKEKALSILHDHLAETDCKLEQLGKLREGIVASIARMELLLEQYRQLNREK